jgi:hypothetical protein
MRLDSEKWITEIAYAVTSLVAEQATAAELAAMTSPRPCRGHPPGDRGNGVVRRVAAEYRVRRWGTCRGRGDHPDQAGVYDEARLRFPWQREDVLIVDDQLGADRRVPVAMSDLYTAEASC